MRNYTYNFEVSTMFTMFIAALDDIIVKRYNKDKVAQDQIQCRFVYAPKQRVLLDLIDKAQNIQLPVIAVSNGGINRDVSRVFNKLQGSHFSSNDPRYSHVLHQPIPIDLTINMSILARYQEDYDQIITNLFPYFDPYIEVSWRIPYIPDYEIRSKVIWSGNVTTQYPTELNANQTARVQGDTSFTFQGWLFKSAPADDGNIFKITVDYSTLPDLTTLYSLSTLNTLYPNTTDRIILSAVPQPRYIEPYWATTLIPTTFNLYGKSLTHITGVYLSGNTNFNSTFYNPFSGTPLSASYPGFYGSILPVSAFTTNNDNEMTFTMPDALSAGRVDVIVQNPAGYGSLTQYVYNPPTSSYTQPFTDGILIGDPAEVITFKYPLDSNNLINISSNTRINNLRITTSAGDSLYPAFNTNTFDYCISNCGNVDDTISYSLHVNNNTVSGTIKVKQALQVYDGISFYYIRFTPNGLPVATVAYGPTSEYIEGYYLIGDYIWKAQAGDNDVVKYFSIYNKDGVPVWFTPSLSAQSTSVELGNQTNRILLNGTTGTSRYVVDINNELTTSKYDILPRLDGSTPWSTLASVPPGLSGWDVREAQIITTNSTGSQPYLNGNILACAYTLSGFYIQIQDSSNSIIWEWNSELYLKPYLTDVYHLNSIDVHPNTGNILVSLRNTSSVFSIDYSTKNIQWVLQGASTNPAATLKGNILPALTASITFLDNANEPTIGAFQYNGPIGQHNAKWRPELPVTGESGSGGFCISLYDDQSDIPGTGTTPGPSARGVIYEINVSNKLAYQLYSIYSDNGTSPFTGAYGITNDVPGDDNPFSHGLTLSRAAYSSVYPIYEEYRSVLYDSVTKVFALNFPGANYYRINKAPKSFLDINKLRITSGMNLNVQTPSVFTPISSTNLLNVYSKNTVYSLSVSANKAILPGYTLYPAFSSTYNDYVIQTNLDPGSSLLNFKLNINNNVLPVSSIKVDSALQVYSKYTSYYIRFLSTAVPVATATIYSNDYTPGYYATVTNNRLNSGQPGYDGYPVIYNELGIPVWYLNNRTSVSIAKGVYNNTFVGNTNTSYIQICANNIGVTDYYNYNDHEAQQIYMPSSSRNGNFIGFDDTGAFTIKEYNPHGTSVWTTGAGSYFSDSEDLDTYHVNSIDVHPVTGNILVSMRHVSCILAIEYSTKKLLWVLGTNQGNDLRSLVVNNSLTTNTIWLTGNYIQNEPTYAGHTYYGPIQQHDARWHTNITPLYSPNNDVISIFDNQTPINQIEGAARGAIFEVDTTNKIAHHISSVFAAPGQYSPYRGSYTVLSENDSYSHTVDFCQLSNYTGDLPYIKQLAEFKGPITLSNTITKPLVFDMHVAHTGLGPYRIIKIPKTFLTLDYLRGTAGLSGINVPKP